MSARQQEYYRQVRQHARRVWEAVNDLVALQREWNALDYSNVLEAGSGENTGLTKTEIGAVVFDTTNATVALLATGHATNIAKVL